MPITTHSKAARRAPQNPTVTSTSPRTRGVLAALIGVCALSFAAVAPFRQGEVDPRDQQALGKLLAKYFKDGAKEEAKEKAKVEITAALEKIGKKKDKSVKDGGEAVLAALYMTRDLGRAMFYSGEYKTLAGGKVLNEDAGDKKSPLPYALSLPKTYKSSGAPQTLILCIPGTKDGKTRTPQDYLTDQLTDSVLRDGAVIAVVTMPAAIANWPTDEGIKAVMYTLRDIRSNVACDADRVYLLGRDQGVATALSICSRFPHLFAGVIGMAGDAGADTGHANFHNLPTFFQGGGGQASAFEAKVKEAGYNNCTVKPEATVADIWAWIQQSPRVSYPSKVTLAPGVPIPNKAYWLSIPPTEGVQGVVKGEADRATNTIVVTTPAVRNITIFFNNELVDLSKPVKIVINGRERQEKITPSVDEWLALFLSGASDAGRVYVARRDYDVPK